LDFFIYLFPIGLVGYIFMFLFYTWGFAKYFCKKLWFVAEIVSCFCRLEDFRSKWLNGSKFVAAS